MRLSLLATVLGCLAALSAAALLPSAPAQAQMPAVPAYKPPAESQVPRRVGGSQRGNTSDLPLVSVLAPDHLGLTVSEQPVLYWYLSASTAARIELALVVPGRPAPLVERVAGGDRAGIQAFRPGVTLEPGVQYEWSVAVVVDPAQRSRDVFTAGAIMRVAASPALATRLASNAQEARAGVFAEAGIWYDALASMSSDIDSHPDDRAKRERRAASLDQAGLAEAAAFERRR
jgi:hypothetical protein